MNQKILEIINEWDPIGLFPLAPKDEYIREIEIIENIISKKPEISTKQLAYELHSMFIERFGNEVYVHGIGDCEEIAKTILEKSS